MRTVLLVRTEDKMRTRSMKRWKLGVLVSVEPLLLQVKTPPQT